MGKELKALCIGFIISFGFYLMYIGIYLMCGPLENSELAWEEIISGLTLLAIGLFCVFFTINYTKKETEKN